MEAAEEIGVAEKGEIRLVPFSNREKIALLAHPQIDDMPAYLARIHTGLPTRTLNAGAHLYWPESADALAEACKQLGVEGQYATFVAPTPFFQPENPPMMPWVSGVQLIVEGARLFVPVVSVAHFIMTNKELENEVKARLIRQMLNAFLKEVDLACITMTPRKQGSATHHLFVSWGAQHHPRLGDRNQDAYFLSRDSMELAKHPKILAACDLIDRVWEQNVVRILPKGEPSENGMNAASVAPVLAAALNRLVNKPSPLAAKLQQANAAFGSGQAEQAAALCLEVLQQPASVLSVDAHFLLGKIFNSKGRHQEAVEQYKKALQLNPRHAPSLTMLGMTLRHLAPQYVPQALLSLREAVRIDPTYLPALSELATALNETQQLEESLTYFDKILELAPEDPVYAVKALASKIHLLERLNRMEEAQAPLARLEAIAPDNPRGLLARAKIEKRAGNLEAALAAAVKAELGWKHAPAIQRAPALIEHAQILEKLKRYKEAFAKFAEAQAAQKEADAPRQVNPEAFRNIVAAYRGWFNTQSQWPRLPAPKDGLKPPLFLVGFPRSGTTLMEQMLSAHPSLTVTDEEAYIEKLLMQSGNVLQRKLQWPNALETLTEEDLRKLRAHYWTLVERKYGKTQGILLDKMPFNLVHLPFVTALWPEAVFLVLLRDPRDVVLSCFQQIFTPNNAMANFYTLESSARLYAEAMGGYLEARDKFHVRRIELRYESWVADPEPALRSIFEALKLAFDPAVLDHASAAKRSYIKTPSYTGAMGAAHTGSIGRWKHYSEEMAKVLPLLAPTMQSLNYQGE